MAWNEIVVSALTGAASGGIVSYAVWRLQYRKQRSDNERDRERDTKAAAVTDVIRAIGGVRAAPALAAAGAYADLVAALGVLYGHTDSDRKAELEELRDQVARSIPREVGGQMFYGNSRCRLPEACNKLEEAVRAVPK